MIRWSEAGPQALRSWALILDNCVPCAVGDAIFFYRCGPRLRTMRVSTARTMGSALGHHAAQRLARGVLGPQPGAGPAPARLGACGLRCARSGSPDAVAPAPRAAARRASARCASARLVGGHAWPLGGGSHPWPVGAGHGPHPPGLRALPRPTRRGWAPRLLRGRAATLRRSVPSASVARGPGLRARPLSRLRPPGSRWEPRGPCWARACRNGHSRAVKAADAPPAAVARVAGQP